MSSTEVVRAAESQDLQQALQSLIDGLAAMPEADTPQDLIQLLLTVAAKRYVAARTAGQDFGPFVHDDALNATEVMVTVTNMLHAAEIELFELAMWAVPGTNAEWEEDQ